MLAEMEQQLKSGVLYCLEDTTPTEIETTSANLQESLMKIDSDIREVRENPPPQSSLSMLLLVFHFWF